MRSTFFRFVPALVIILTGAAMPGVSVFAQDDAQVHVQLLENIPVTGDFQLGPTRLDLPLAPGTTQSVTLQLTNREGTTATYSVALEDFAAGADAEYPTQLYGTEDGPFSARRWLSVGALHLTLRHGERAFIPVTITVPENADAGDHYASVLVQRDPESPEGGNGVQVISRVGSLFLITVAGPVEKAGDLTGITSSPSVHLTLPVDLTVTAKNDGTVHLAPQGMIEIRNVFGYLVDQIPVQDWIVLRNSTRPVTVTWAPHFALGRYRATANLNVGPGLTLTPVTTVFWVLPITTILLVIVGIALLGFMLRRIVSRLEIRRK